MNDSNITQNYIQATRNIIESDPEPRTYKVVTFGCQMNARDSEKIEGVLKKVGLIEAESEDADFVLYNTCTVRDNANKKVYGRLGELKKFKKKNPRMKIALCGCMMQEKGVPEDIKKRFPFVDLVFGTHNIAKFPKLLYETISGDQYVCEIIDEDAQGADSLPVSRHYSFKTGINIMYGCNNFCSYCIVPYVRGRERSRTPEDILSEIKRVAGEGVVEIMLLGQNVNSYSYGFAPLLREVEKIDGIRRIRFMTSHPKDLSDELIDTMASSEKICRHLHLPLQSGSTKVLSEMNRRYTKDQYLKLAKKIRDAMPDIALTTDIMVGFPGETEEDFEETMDVVRQVQFDNAFTFIYSKRNGTPAAARDDQIPPDVVKNRFEKLLSLVQQAGAMQAKKREGDVCEVLVESVNHQDPRLVTGRISNNSVVHFPGDKSLIGKFVPVRLSECKGFYYIGEECSV